jgi:LysM repeat protein
MRLKRILFLAMLSILALAGCAPAAEIDVNDAVPQGATTLVPYRTRTALPAPTQVSLPTPTPLPSPTPTPRTHTVAKGEDLGGIAYLYGTTVPALLAANPGIDPYLMSVGTVLVIPNAAEDQALAASPAATPVPVEVQPPDCWPARDGGVWCFALVGNPLDTPVESVSVLMSMAAAEGSPAASWKVAPLLNVIPAGASLPAGAYFSPPVPDVPAVSAQLLAALPAADLEERYLPVQLDVESVEISGDGSTARLEGRLNLERDEAEDVTVWVALTARNTAGQVIGWRRWEGRLSLGGGDPASFTAEVYAVGGTKIASVEALAEAKP